MRRNLRSRRGFTLIEVLVVVALIVILLAIAIPSVMGVLNNTRHKTDAGYERAAAALATGLDQTGSLERDQVYLYDVNGSGSSRLVPADGTFTPTGYAPYGECGKDGHQGQFLWVRYETNKTQPDLCWSAEKPADAGWNACLCSNE